MGRVSRYKKVKASDPFYRGPRKQEQRDVDRRPENEDEQPMPKSLVRLIRSMEGVNRGDRTKKGTVLEKKAEVSKGSGSGETLTAGSHSGKEKEAPMFERQKGESVRDFFDRVDVEANVRIMESYRANRKMSDRRKRYLEERRKKFKARKGKLGEEREDKGEEEEGNGMKTSRKPPMDFSDLKDDVRFGERAMAPPKLGARPRGVGKTVTKGKTNLLLQAKLTSAQESTGKVTATKPVDSVGLKRKHDLEEEREKAIEVYRQSKKSRLARTKDTTSIL